MSSIQDQPRWRRLFAEHAAVTTVAQLHDRFALITGGSTGIGAAIAEAVAREGAHLVLVARDKGRLEDAAARIRLQHGVTVLTVALDLSAPGAAAVLLDIVGRAGIEIELLVNSAGMSLRGLVADTHPAVLRQLVNINVGALTELSAAVAGQMVSRGHGSIVNIASTGAYSPAPALAAYAASKAYVLSFTQALSAEVKNRGVRVVSVSPGPTQTAMNAGGGRGRRKSEQVARTVLSALDGSAPAVVDGSRNSIVAALMRVSPAPLMARISRRRIAD